MDRKSIRWNYIRKIYNGRFFWDCISLLGLLIDTFSINFSYKWITYLFFYTKIYFVVEFDTFIMQFIRLNRKTSAAYKIFRLFLTVLFISNILACIYYRIGIETEEIYQTNWITTIPYQDAANSVSLIYLYSLYWSIGTMATVAYGDIVPQNPIEVIYVCFVMFIATVTFGYIINSVLEIVDAIESGSEKVQRKITAIQRYMRDKNVNENLQNRVLNYVKYQLLEDKERDKETEQDIISILPPHIRAELFYEVNTFFFRKFEWTNKFSEQFITALSFEIEEVHLMEDIILYEPSYVEDEDDINLYYLASGQVEIKKDLPQYNYGQGLQLHTIKVNNKTYENSFIGLYSFASGNMIKEVLKCKTPVKVFIINRHKFQETIQNFPDDLKLWNIYQDKIINQRKYEEFNIQCYNCLTYNHVLEECSLMSRKQTLLDKRERQNFLTTSQKNIQTCDDSTSKYFGRKGKDLSQIVSSQQKAEQLIGQSIQETDQKDEEESPDLQKQSLDQILKQPQISKILSENEVYTKEEIQQNQKDEQEEQNDFFDKKKNLKSVRIVEDDNDYSKIKSQLKQESFMQLQEQNIDDHIKHQVYQESEHDKWEQRARIKERIAKKQALQHKRSVQIAPGNNDDVLVQMIQCIQNVLQQNNMDFNQLQALSQGMQLGNQNTQSQFFGSSYLSQYPKK